jgi:hypothetical protein
MSWFSETPNDSYKKTDTQLPQQETDPLLPIPRSERTTIPGQASVRARRSNSASPVALLSQQQQPSYQLPTGFTGNKSDLLSRTMEHQRIEEDEAPGYRAIEENARVAPPLRGSNNNASNNPVHESSSLPLHLPPILEIPEEIYSIRKSALQVLKPLTKTWVSLFSCTIYCECRCRISPFLNKVSISILSRTSDCHICWIFSQRTVWDSAMDSTPTQFAVLVYTCAMLVGTYRTVMATRALSKSTF